MKVMQGLLTVLLFAGMVGILYCLFTMNLNKDLENIFMFLSGAISSAFTQSVNYWIGSSRGSAEKQKMIATLSEKE